MAWTITETIRHFRMKRSGWNLPQAETLVEIKLACTSDAGASDYDIENMDQIKGSYLYLCKIVPATGGDIPAAVFDLDIEDENDNHILDTIGNPVAPTGGATYHQGSATMGVYPPVGDHVTSQVSLACATLGDGNKADVYLYFSM